MLLRASPLAQSTILLSVMAYLQRHGRYRDTGVTLRWYREGIAQRPAPVQPTLTAGGTAGTAEHPDSELVVGRYGGTGGTRCGFSQSGDSCAAGGGGRRSASIISEELGSKRSAIGARVLTGRYTMLVLGKFTANMLADYRCYDTIRYDARARRCYRRRRNFAGGPPRRS
ncbi:hypothetical protein CALCODRAFT_127032 [Calocera cornea HHB12733]|uniref:Uncharacterized protein n=1 Tax=Calocera cornea HHB12733 TaxID=1353952 RepID=A0A165I889_9BASI|nr:hypothetical protein CALCODRAFT_127032 [Calocera cornea HHB12733]